MKNNKKIIKIITITITTISVFLFFFIIANNNIVNAVDEYILLEPLPGMGGTGVGPGVGVYLQSIYKIGLGIAGILAVVMITIGGVMYMTTEAVGGKSDAKNKINNAIIGLILALSSFLLLKTINPAFISSELSLTPVPGPPIVDPDPLDKMYSGMCRPFPLSSVSQLCWGDSQGDCTTHCNSLCPSEKISEECKKVAGSSNWRGSCYLPTTMGEVKIKYEETSLEKCQTEQASRCARNPVQTEICTLNGND